MTTAIAYSLTLFSTAVLLLATTGWALLRRRDEARRAAQRITVTFAVFAIAAGYVWLEVGPDLDHRLQAWDQPLLARPAPQEQEV
jgi:hypothetical protein